MKSVLVFPKFCLHRFPFYGKINVSLRSCQIRCRDEIVSHSFSIGPPVVQQRRSSIVHLANYTTRWVLLPHPPTRNCPTPQPSQRSASLDVYAVSESALRMVFSSFLVLARIYTFPINIMLTGFEIQHIS